MSQSAPGGVVLAANFLFLDEQTLRFWADVAARLQDAGLQFLMLSTTEVDGAPFPVLPIPYQLPEFGAHYGARGASPPPAWARQIVGLAAHAQPSVPPARVSEGVAVATEFYADLFEALQPVAVIGWNGMHAHTQLFVGIARLCGIPAWSAERGWLRDTMMFDMGENSLLSEWGQCMALRAMSGEVAHDTALFERLRAHALARRAGKYPCDPALAVDAARRQLGLDARQPVIAAFTHAEPGVHGPVGSARGAVHDASRSLLDARLAQVAQHARARGAVLLVQEHPINVQTRVRRPQALQAGARFVQENPYTLLELAAASLHTHSTVQFDAVFVGKPIVLLGRTMLSLASAPGAYALADHPGVGDCIDAALAATDWPVRRRSLETLVTTIARYQLIDMGLGLVPRDAGLVVDTLCGYRRAAPSDLDARVDAFLRCWSEPVAA